MRSSRSSIVSLAVTTAMMAAPGPVHADTAGEEDPDGGEEVPVSAEAETVDIDANLVRDADGTVRGVLFSLDAYRVLSGRLAECDVLDECCHRADLRERRPSCEPPETDTFAWVLATVAVSAAIAGGYVLGRATTP